MKIAIPADDSTLETAVCVSFGRTPFFMLYDSDSKETAFIVNDAADSQGGAGIKAAQCVVDQGTDVLLTPRCGENAAEVLKAAGVRIYKTADGSAMDNVRAFTDGGLSPLGEIHEGLHHHGGTLR